MLVKHVSHIEEIQKYFTKEKIQRILYFENKIQHKIKEFVLEPGSLVLLKNLAIKLLANKKKSLNT